MEKEREYLNYFRIRHIFIVRLVHLQNRRKTLLDVYRPLGIGFGGVKSRNLIVDIILSTFWPNQINYQLVYLATVVVN